MRPLVNFMIAGAQKGGTTALFDYLSEEPGVALSHVKETHFFDDDSRDWAQPDYGAYHAQFEPAGSLACGEATPIYLFWPGALERVAAYNPAMRLILALREPVDRAWSHWRMEVSRGAETQPFPWCIREGRQRLFAEERWGWHRDVSYVERGFYGEQVERLLSLFPAEQLLILRSEDLRRDPGQALSQVRAFLGLPPGAAPARRETHVTPPIAHGPELQPEDAAFLAGLYARDLARLRELAGVTF